MCRHWPEEGKLKSRSGTPVYMAPEVIMQEYGPPADLWSIGMLLYQLLTGTFPFWDSVQNLSLQQASSQALLPVLCSPVLPQHLTVKRQTLADRSSPRCRVCVSCSHALTPA